MEKKPLIVGSICAVVVFVLGSLSRMTESQSVPLLSFYFRDFFNFI